MRNTPTSSEPNLLRHASPRRESESGCVREETLVNRGILTDPSGSSLLRSPEAWAPARAREGSVSPLLVCIVLAGLLAYDLLRLSRNFAGMHHFVSNWKRRTRTARGDLEDRVCKAVNQACVWYPKRVLCLQRSAVTTCLLRTCGIPAQMVMGAQNIPFKAHAWTEIEGRVVNERRDVQKIYRVWERC